MSNDLTTQDETNKTETNDRAPTSAPFPIMQPAMTIQVPRSLFPNETVKEPFTQNKPIVETGASIDTKYTPTTSNQFELMNEFFGISVKLSMHQNLEFMDETSPSYYLNFNISPQLDVILNKVRKLFVLRLVKESVANKTGSHASTSTPPNPFLPIAIDCVNEFLSSEENLTSVYNSSGEFVAPEAVNKVVKYNEVKKYEFDLYKMLNRLLTFINTRIGGVEIVMIEPDTLLINFSAGLSLLDQINKPVRAGFNSLVFNFQLMFVAIFIGIVNNLLNSVGLPNFVDIEPNSTRMDAKLKINYSSVIFDKNIPAAARCDVLTDLRAMTTPLSDRALTYHISTANLDGAFKTAGHPVDAPKKNSSPFVVDSRGNQVEGRTHNIIKTLMVSGEEFNALTEKLEQTIASFNKLILDNAFTSILFLNTQSYKISLTDVSRLLGTTAVEIFGDPKYSYVLSLFATFYGINASFISNCQMKCFHRFELCSKFEPKIDSNVLYTLGDNHIKFNKLFEYMNGGANNFNIVNTVGPLVDLSQRGGKTHILVKQSGQEYAIEFLCEKFVYLKIAIYMFMHAIILNMPPVYVEIREFNDLGKPHCRPLEEHTRSYAVDDPELLDELSNSMDELRDFDSDVDSNLEEPLGIDGPIADFYEEITSTHIENNPVDNTLNSEYEPPNSKGSAPFGATSSPNSEYITVSVEPVISTELKSTDICSMEPELLSITLDFIEKMIKMCIGIDSEINDIAISRKIDAIVNESIMNNVAQFALREFLPAVKNDEKQTTAVTNQSASIESNSPESKSTTNSTKLDFKKFVGDFAKNIKIVNGCAVHKNYKSSTM